MIKRFLTSAYPPDLVEENRSAIGDFEQSGLGAVRFGVSPAPIPAPRPAENRERIRRQKSDALSGHESLTLAFCLATKIPTLAQLVSKITPDNRYPEIPTGPEVGKEGNVHS